MSSLFGLALARNVHSVNWASRLVPPTGTGGNLGRSSAGVVDILNYSHAYRIRADGNITQAKFYVADLTNVDVVTIKIWRKINTGLYDLVGETENLLSQLTAGAANTITFRPIAVQEGDFPGLFISVTGASAYQFYGHTGITGAKLYYTTTEATTPDYAWESQTLATGSAVRLQLFGPAPHLVTIGDSIMAGGTTHTSFISGTDLTALGTDIGAIIGAVMGWVVQNMGMGSETTTDIAARITADLVNLYPRLAIINGGVNDFAGAGSQATFIANWTTILDACEAAGIISVVCKIMPWTNGTNTQMQTRDTWNAALVTLAANYADAIVVDFDAALGQFRAGGDAGNLWDIADAYDADGVHPNPAGLSVAAQVILDALTATERNAIADAALSRAVSNVEATADKHSLAYVILAMSEASTATGSLVVNQSDGVTVFTTKTPTFDANARPMTGIS